MLSRPASADTKAIQKSLKQLSTEENTISTPLKSDAKENAPHVLNGLLDKSLIIAENPEHILPKKFLIQNMEALAKMGYTTLFIGELYTFEQDDLDIYTEDPESKTALPDNLRQRIYDLDENYHLKNHIKPTKYSYREVLRAAKHAGIRIIGLSQPSYNEGETFLSVAADVITEHLGHTSSKWIALIDAKYLSELKPEPMPQPDESKREHPSSRNKIIAWAFDEALAFLFKKRRRGHIRAPKVVPQPKEQPQPNSSTLSSGNEINQPSSSVVAPEEQANKDSKDLNNHNSESAPSSTNELDQPSSSMVATEEQANTSSKNSNNNNNNHVETKKIELPRNPLEKVLREKTTNTDQKNITNVFAIFDKESEEQVISQANTNSSQENVEKLAAQLFSISKNNHSLRMPGALGLQLLANAPPQSIQTLVNELFELCKEKNNPAAMVTLENLISELMKNRSGINSKELENKEMIALIQDTVICDKMIGIIKDILKESIPANEAESLNTLNDMFVKEGFEIVSELLKLNTTNNSLTIEQPVHPIVSESSKEKTSKKKENSCDITNDVKLKHSDFKEGQIYRFHADFAMYGKPRYKIPLLSKKNKLEPAEDAKPVLATESDKTELKIESISFKPQDNDYPSAKQLVSPKALIQEDQPENFWKTVLICTAIGFVSSLIVLGVGATIVATGGGSIPFFMAIATGVAAIAKATGFTGGIAALASFVGLSTFAGYAVGGAIAEDIELEIIPQDEVINNKSNEVDPDKKPSAKPDATSSNNNNNNNKQQELDGESKIEYDLNLGYNDGEIKPEDYAKQFNSETRRTEERIGSSIYTPPSSSPREIPKPETPKPSHSLSKS